MQFFAWVSLMRIKKIHVDCFSLQMKHQVAKETERLP